MSLETYAQFYALLERQVGIQLDHTKKYLTDSRLAHLATEHGHDSVASLVKFLTTSPIGSLHWNAFEALTTNETYFFRDKQVFDGLAQTVLPQLMEARRSERALRIYCAAASTGQEVYSLLMMMRELFSDLKAWDVFVQASDISEGCLERAKLGVYNLKEVERGLPPEFLPKYFDKLPDGNFKIAAGIRDAVHFSRQNLLDEPAGYPKFDLILLRNVLIYFGNETKVRILKNIHKQLARDHGLLLLGATESLLSHANFRAESIGKVSFYAAV